MRESRCRLYKYRELCEKGALRPAPFGSGCHAGLRHKGVSSLLVGVSLAPALQTRPCFTRVLLQALPDRAVGVNDE